MKNSKKLKLILIILICVLIILSGIFGIYAKKSNTYANLIPDYTFASDIKGATVLELEVDTSKDTIYLDKDGNEVDSSKVTEDNKKEYTTKEVPTNAEENLNTENYKKCLDIMKERLKLLDAAQYQLDLNETDGKIILTVSDDYIEDIESILPMEGKLQVINSDTEEVMLDYTDFKSAEATYASLDEEVRTYISLKLNESGIEKYNNLVNDKVTVENAENNEEETESEEIKLKVLFDSDEIAEITKDDLTLVGGKKLRITTGSGLTSNSEIQSQLNMNTVVSRLATIGKMPVVYKLTVEEFMNNNIKDYISYIVIGLIAVAVIFSIIFILRYKLNGLLAVLGFVTNAALFLIVIRLTNIEISLNSFAGILGVIVLYAMISNILLKELKNEQKAFVDNVKVAVLNSLDLLIIALILLVVLTFTNMALINTVGLLIFWGWLITVLGNLIFTIPMLYLANNK